MRSMITEDQLLRGLKSLKPPIRLRTRTAVLQDARASEVFTICWLREAIMLQTASWLLAELSLFLVTAVVTHLVMSFAQTLMIFNKRTGFSGATANAVEPIVAAAKLNTARFMQPAKNGLPQCALINSGVNVKGNLETDGELHIDGQIVGNVSCGHLVIGKDGAVRGDIKAD
jgi:Polymer-forming cytoskeletal